MGRKIDPKIEVLKRRMFSASRCVARRGVCYRSGRMSEPLRPTLHIPRQWAEPFGILLGHFQRLELQLRSAWCSLRWKELGHEVEVEGDEDPEWVLRIAAWKDPDIQKSLGKKTFHALLSSLFEKYDLDFWEGMRFDGDMDAVYEGPDVPLLLLRNAMAHAMWLSPAPPRVFSSSPTQPRVSLLPDDVLPIRLRIDAKTVEVERATATRLRPGS